MSARALFRPDRRDPYRPAAEADHAPPVYAKARRSRRSRRKERRLSCGARLLVWGIALSRAYSRLYPAPAAAPVVSAPAPDSAVRRLNRRQFLIELGGASAAITVIGAGVGELLASREERDLEATIKARREAAEHNRRAAQCRCGRRAAPAPGRNTPRSKPIPIDINSAPGRYRRRRVALRIHGRVDQAGRIDADDLGHLSPREPLLTLACITNPDAGDLISTLGCTRRQPARDVLADAGVRRRGLPAHHQPTGFTKARPRPGRGGTAHHAGLSLGRHPALYSTASRCASTSRTATA